MYIHNRGIGAKGHAPPPYACRGQIYEAAEFVIVQLTKYLCFSWQLWKLSTVRPTPKTCAPLAGPLLNRAPTLAGPLLKLAPNYPVDS